MWHGAMSLFWLGRKKISAEFIRGSVNNYFIKGELFLHFFLGDISHFNTPSRRRHPWERAMKLPYFDSAEKRERKFTHTQASDHRQFFFESRPPVSRKFRNKRGREHNSSFTFRLRGKEGGVSVSTTDQEKRREEENLICHKWQQKVSWEHIFSLSSFAFVGKTPPA